ncbi:MAG TPA: hypothetical protein VIM75_17440 [Ohtaekwangia sp.]|uniref:hypothetical protein n=1 Tax=Ohtaekwangia sp. TaxID=2066019 RepID=UPI002F931633
MKLIRLYLGTQWLAWFAINLSFVELMAIDRYILENAESVSRLIILIAFYYTIADKREYIKKLLVAFPILFLLSLLIVSNYNNFTLNFILRFTNGIIGLISGCIFFARMLKELPVENLSCYRLFWFNTAFTARSGGIVWIVLLMAFSTPLQSIDSALLREFFSVLGVIECLLLSLGIVSLQGRQLGSK